MGAVAAGAESGFAGRRGAAAVRGSNPLLAAWCTAELWSPRCGVVLVATCSVLPQLTDTERERRTYTMGRHRNPDWCTRAVWILFVTCVVTGAGAQLSAGDGEARQFVFRDRRQGRNTVYLAIPL